MANCKLSGKAFLLSYICSRNNEPLHRRIAKTEDTFGKTNRNPSKGHILAIVTVLVLVFILLALFLYYPKFWSPSTTQPSPYPSTTATQSTFPSQSPSTLNPSSGSPSKSPTTTPNPTQPSATQLELVNYALSLINADRQQNGVSNVTLSNINSGQLHAEDMLKNNYFSHWDLNGYKPYVRYTLAGGKGAVDENIAATLGYYSDLKKAIANSEWQMMNDDAQWNWGHRDNIINPLHNKVSIGIAYDSNNIYFVEDFENDYIAWSMLEVNNTQVIMQGTIQRQNSTIESIAIFHDNLTTLTVAQMDSPPYNGAYDPGTYVGLALPPNWQAQGAITITADSWSQNGGDFQISFSLSKAISAYGKGVYTLYVEIGSSTADALTDYSVIIT